MQVADDFAPRSGNGATLTPFATSTGLTGVVSATGAAGVCKGAAVPAGVPNKLCMPCINIELGEFSFATGADFYCGVATDGVTGGDTIAGAAGKIGFAGACFLAKAADERMSCIVSEPGLSGLPISC